MSGLTYVYISTQHPWFNGAWEEQFTYNSKLAPYALTSCANQAAIQLLDEPTSAQLDGVLSQPSILGLIFSSQVKEIAGCEHCVWVRKPINMGYCINIITAFKPNTNSGLPLPFGTFFPQRRHIVSAHSVIHLTEKESELLMYLCTHPPADHATLLQDVWGQTHMTTRTIETIFYRLRQKIGHDLALKDGLYHFLNLDKK